MMAGSNCFQKKLLWTPLLICILLASYSVEVTASSQHRDEDRSVLSRLYYDSERPPPQVAPSATPLPVSVLSTHPKPVKLHNAVLRKPESRDDIQIPSHPTIEKYIKYYQGKGRKPLAKALKRSSSYISVISRILDSYGVPSELLYVVFVESSFQRTAHGKGDARGFWQLVPTTARQMGLRVDRTVDERLDPVKSTHAAARYLRTLYDQFNSWPLALAAYNAGEGTVRKALGDRWPYHDLRDISLLNPLPSTTRDYVSKIMALIHVTRSDLFLHDNI